MQAHQEVELKWLLEPAGHLRLGTEITALLGSPRRLQQQNRFYDTADRRLFAAGVNLRLRCENGQWIVTCKQRVAAQDGLHHHQEWEQHLGEHADPLSVALAGSLPAVVRTALAGAVPACLGGFDNMRLAWNEGSEEIALDETRFAGRTDYELEVETTDVVDCRRRWDQRCTAWGVATEPATTTKFARFLALR